MAISQDGMTEGRPLLSLISTSQPSRAPDKIEFTSYRGGVLIPLNGADHMIWTIAIGKDHSASVIMHKDDYAALMDMSAT